MKEKFKVILPYLLVLFGFFFTVIITIVILDKVLFPILVHSEETLKMPNLVGMKLSDAEKTLSSLNLKIARVSELYSEQYPPGTVINQSPRAGQIIRVGRDVFLTISQGKEEVEVPNLIGQNIRNSRILLKNNGLDIGNITYVNDERFGIDTIVAQSPQPGSKVSYGRTVDLVVSRGSVDLVKMPFIEGLNLDNALKIITESGLQVGNIVYVDNQTYLPNTVLNQGIKAGELVKKGTLVDLTVVR
ncbi:MAG: PASTA domain-containing protein [Ignavibacteria bacterium]|nr:PASTA domain-containing protein [Ignavibacteria bacterium]